jgi:flagellar hook protein FlgE
MSSFAVPLSGLNAANTALDIVSNDLANMSTTGYKDNTVSFYDLLSQSVGGGSLQVGGGVSATQSQAQFTQGSIQQTGGAFDGAIQGNGLFVLQNAAGGTEYTRAGNFQLNADGQLVTGNGQFVQGWSSVGGVINTSGAIGGITVPSNSLQTPSATTQFSLSMNLQADATVGTSAASFSAPIQVVDSLGQTHDLTVNFTETAANTWTYTVTVPGQDLTAGTAGTPSQLATGSLAFDGNGNMITPAPPGQVAIKITGLADKASDMNITWNLFDSNNNPTITQFAAASTLSGSTQNGIAAAQVTQVSLSNGGSIVAQFSNGDTQVIGQLALASVSNPNTLISVGDSNFEVGPNTATPVVGVPGTGSLGTIEGGSLETSNVDIATEFTNLIVYQSFYQANSRVISTQEALIQDLLNIGPQQA